jgi:hypothetical protein
MRRTPRTVIFPKTLNNASGNISPNIPQHHGKMRCAMLWPTWGRGHDCICEVTGASLC